MITHYRTQAFVFKKEDRQEADRIFTLFTRDFGRVEVTARAIRRLASKLRSGIEIFSLSEIEFIQSNYRNTLTDAIKIGKLPDIPLVPEKIEIANKVSAIVDNFIGGQETDQKIWDLLVDFFQKLNDCRFPNTNYHVVYFYFFWNFIAVLGYGPQLLQCAHCSQALNPANLYFSNKEGGVICLMCVKSDNQSQRIHQDVVKILRIILSSQNGVLLAGKNIPVGGWEIILKLKIEKNHQESLELISKQYGDYVLSLGGYKLW